MTNEAITAIWLAGSVLILGFGCFACGRVGASEPLPFIIISGLFWPAMLALLLAMLPFMALHWLGEKTRKDPA